MNYDGTLALSKEFIFVHSFLTFVRDFKCLLKWQTVSTTYCISELYSVGSEHQGLKLNW